MAFLEADPASWSPPAECDVPHCAEATVEALEKSVIQAQEICTSLFELVGVDDDDTFMEFLPDGMDDSRIGMQTWQTKLIGKALRNLQVWSPSIFSSPCVPREELEGDHRFQDKICPTVSGATGPADRKDRGAICPEKQSAITGK